ncbi:hypothetical protein DC3_43450 [Deinococcus cellulosilyticus NBRC 106333 = KACC 11606]|uniref:Thoeris protein ThsB TIR-like domain-containing protein n=2 Tax=Deinococcus cellulosilyticus TaxID=401558 RepID=A0A511N7A3_DEIC1|nr:hypothetical protein DC3_43450 [Deinococcus cellulosilyticus NBRC 106333 = KACC 11606]
MYNILTDNSLQRALNSDNAAYIDRAVRENYIHGSSITVVLCGAETYKRKFVDWEIYATLLYDHALLGIVLPTCERDWTTAPYLPKLPARLRDNVNSGYAHLISYTTNPQQITVEIEKAITMKRSSLINNKRSQMSRNL